jgi:hypothetical protein
MVPLIPGRGQVEYFTSTDLLEGLRAAGGLPAATEIPLGRGHAEWLGAHLRYRLTLKQLQTGAARWTLAVGDRHLGRSFHDGGILALVQVTEVASAAPLGWPATEAEVVPFLHALYGRLAPAAAFVADRRDLCTLLLSPGEVRRGDLVVDLRARYVERVLRALCVARAAGDGEMARLALATLQAPPAAATSGGPTSLLDQARIWADQWSYQSGLHIEVPESLDALDALGAFDGAGGRRPDPVVAPAPAPAAAAVAPADRPRPDQVPTFWDRVG